MIDIQCKTFEGRNEDCQIDKLPDTCPICGNRIKPSFNGAYKIKENYGGNEHIQIVCQCVVEDCKCLFIAYFSSVGRSAMVRNYYTLDESGIPFYETKEEFGKVIEKISPKFSLIYNEALLAEKNGLMEICGPGYRKSLEFLVKDYCIKNYPEKAEEIKSMSLGNAIKEIDDKRIQQCAEKATWLGNDETHYVRKHTDKDLNDLKSIIKLTINWIELEEGTKEVMKMEAK